MFRYAYRNELKPVYRNNSIRALNSNTQMFSETIRLIKSAKHFIHFETYILHDGFFLRAVLAELIKKAREGVEVRLLYD
jgi:cardiolipin synthase